MSTASTTAAQGTMRRAVSTGDRRGPAPELPVTGLGPCGGEERECDLDHRLDVRDGDVLVRRVDLGHPVRQVDALEAALVEDVRVGGAAREGVVRLDPAGGECLGGEAHCEIVTSEPVAGVAALERRLDLAF